MTAALAGAIVLIAAYASPAQATIIACEWEKVSSWTNGFQIKVTLINNGIPVDGWTATWTWDDGTKVTNAWDAIVTQPGQSMSASNQSYNGYVPSFGRVSFGFLATGVSDGHGGGLRVNGGPLLPC
ncbi:cellulose binding domain-containing protein [Nonomuraea angiospora]|uniref:cellulose binding domain-containing protein n=1 Tax=Nonomuraea angiospora TaxID=46172 RepID=UPI0029A4BC9B|nr:cellulose binding domain-containing protein [Nonomuraea angiospora]MDX3100197.1 cellulose binding domain-containing protein [Nonomuraea angiospora]